MKNDTPSAPKSSSRDLQRAQALRANLQRRKAQARAQARTQIEPVPNIDPKTDVGA